VSKPLSIKVFLVYTMNGAGEIPAPTPVLIIIWLKIQKHFMM